MSRSHHSAAPRPLGRAATLFAALLAVFLQAFVVQTHVHAFGNVREAGYEQSSTGHGSDAHVSNGGEKFGCAICDVLATAGHSTLPDAPAVAAKAVASNEAAALAIRNAPRAIAHSWQSRAPPIAL